MCTIWNRYSLGATLNFEIELIGWTTTDDVSHDGGVMKETITPGANYERCPRTAEVFIK